MNHFWALTSLGLTTGFGVLLIRACDSQGRLRILERLALGFTLGLGLITWWMLVLHHFNQSFCLRSVLGGLALAALPLLWIGRGRRSNVCWKSSAEGWSWTERLLLGAVLSQVLAAFFHALAKPMHTVDAVYNWGLKGKAIALAGRIPGELLGNPDYPHPEYPLLVPLAQAYTSLFIGEHDDFAAKWIFPVFLLAMSVFLYASLRRILLDRQPSLFLVFMLVSIPFVTEQASNGYADWVLSVYFSMSAICLYLWIVETGKVWLWASAGLGGLSGLTKDEGLALCLLLFGVVIGFSCSKAAAFAAKKRLKILSTYGLILCVILLPWLLLKQSIVVPDAEMHQDRLFAVGWDRVLRVLPIAYQYQSQVFGLRVWNLLWLIFVVSIGLRFRKLMEPPTRFLFLSVVGVFFIYTAVYFMIPNYSWQDITWYLRTTASRLLLHPLAAVVFTLGLLYQAEVGPGKGGQFLRAGRPVGLGEHDAASLDETTG